MNKERKYWDVGSIFDKDKGDKSILIMQEKEDKYVDLSKYLNGDKESFSKYIDALYKSAQKKPDVKIFIPFRLDHGANKMSDNFTERDIVELFIKGKEVPDNVVFHRSYKNTLNQEIVGIKNQRRIKELTDRFKNKNAIKGASKKTPKLN